MKNKDRFTEGRVILAGRIQEVLRRTGRSEETGAWAIRELKSLVLEYRSVLGLYRGSKRFFMDIFYLSAEVFLESASGERVALMRFFTEQEYFRLLGSWLQTELGEVFVLRGDVCVRLFNAMGTEREKEKAIIGCHLYGYIQEPLQEMVRSLVEDEKDGFSCRQLVDALLSGCVRYDEYVYQRLCRGIEECSSEQLESACRENPAWMLTKLFFWGYIDEYELKRYEVFYNRSGLLTLLIHPELFRWDKMRREWECFHTHPAYVRYREEYNREKLAAAIIRGTRKQG